jgi:DNA-binding CsgD family transcriptional regulator
MTEAKKMVRSLKKQKAILLHRIDSFEERLTRIESSLPSEKVILLREISKKDAEKEICKLFSEGKVLYYSDIAEKLGLDLKTVVDICSKLQKRGEIKVDDNVQKSR